MSWDLLIYRPSDNPSDSLPLGPPQEIREAFDSKFSTLNWRGENHCSLDVDRGFDLSLHIENGLVSSISVRGGYDHLPLFAALCEDRRWTLLDMQFGEPVDPQKPYARYEADA